MRTLELFVFLQILDVLTTLLGLRLGAAEANPAIRFMMTAGPVAGLIMGKSLAFGIGAVCVVTGRMRAIGWLNYWCAALVTWNFLILFRSVQLI